MFHCARCRRLVVICRRCDRGQRCCSAACALGQRRRSVREAGRRYQRSPLGARNNAARQKRWRLRRVTTVTHHPSAAQPPERRARAHRGLDRLAAAAPASRELLTRLAQRGANLGSATARLLGLLDEFGAARLEPAIREALHQDLPHHHAVRQILERQCRAEGRRPALPVELPEDARVRELTVRPHPLASYDALTQDLIAAQEPDDHEESDPPSRFS